MSVEVANCVMCNESFPAAELDYCGRCDQCFYKFMQMKDEDKPNLGIPGQPGYNSTWKK